MSKDYSKYLDQIRANDLMNLDYDFLVAQLCVLNNMPYEDISEIVDKLIADKKLRLNPNGDYESEVNRHLHIDPKKSHKVSRKNFVIGKISMSGYGYAFLIPKDEEIEDIYISAKDLHGAVNNDVVEVEVFYNESRMRGTVKKIIERGNQNIVGVIKYSRKDIRVIPDDVKFGKDIIIPRGKTMGAKDGYKVVARIEKYYDGRTPAGEVCEVLGKPNEIESEVLSVIRAYNLYENFPDKVVVAADKIPQTVDISKYQGRRDLRDELIFTIDGEDTRDIDDAISLTKNKDGTYKLGVHIADVGEYVPYNSVLDREAFKRATSVYFPNRVLPMLPRQLSNGICSLNEGCDRLTLSCVMTLDNAGKVLDYDIFESIIRSKKRFTYKIVQQILDGDKIACRENKDFVEPLFEMNNLSKALIAAREKRGAIDFNFPEVEIILDNLGDVIDLHEKPREDAHRLIESFMIAANECVALKFCKNNTPFVYRIHEKPSVEKMASFLSTVSSMGLKAKFDPSNVSPKDLQKVLTEANTHEFKDMINQLCLRSLRKAKYSSKCLGHFGIASTYYCHFTSPIRRYPDLTIHRIIKEYLHGKLNSAALKFDKSFVISSASQSSEREVVADNAERDVDDLYRAFYMTHHIAEEFDGKVSGVTNFGVFVKLDNTCEGMIAISDLPVDDYDYSEDRLTLTGRVNKYYIGKPIRVKVIRSDILSREIDMVEITQLDNK